MPSSTTAGRAGRHTERGAPRAAERGRCERDARATQRGPGRTRARNCALRGRAAEAGPLETLRRVTARRAGREEWTRRWATRERLEEVLER